MSGALAELATSAPNPVPGWDLAADVRAMLAYPFMVNAFRAGTVVAVVAGVVGWFMVVRRQTFVGHTLAVVGFPGAAAAVLVGVSASYGFLSFSVAAALVIAALPQAGRAGASAESAVTGTVQAVALALGFLFVSLSGSLLSGVQAPLFGSLFGVTAQDVVLLVVLGVVVVSALAAIGRPLLFASLDPAVAEARGVPVRALSYAFLLLLGVTAGEVSQVTGALLVFALLVVPAASAQVLTADPRVSLALTVVLSLAVTWSALFAAYYSPYPVGFWLTTIAFAAYLLSVARGALAKGAR